MQQAVDALDLARTGHHESAFHLLVELGETAIPILADAYRSERDPAVRSLIVEAVWQMRSPRSLDLLAEALQDPEPGVWRQALDGLATLASSESLRVLESAMERAEAVEGREDFRDWVEGAIENVRGRIDE